MTVIYSKSISVKDSAGDSDFAVECLKSLSSSSDCVPGSTEWPWVSGCPASNDEGCTLKPRPDFKIGDDASGTGVIRLPTFAFAALLSATFSAAGPVPPADTLPISSVGRLLDSAVTISRKSFLSSRLIIPFCASCTASIIIFCRTSRGRPQANFGVFFNLSPINLWKSFKSSPDKLAASVRRNLDTRRSRNLPARCLSPDPSNSAENSRSEKTFRYEFCQY